MGAEVLDLEQVVVRGHLALGASAAFDLNELDPVFPAPAAEQLKRRVDRAGGMNDEGDSHACHGSRRVSTAVQAGRKPSRA